jgi:4-hydroxy-3-methylbut-2-enyl diphosphate reductase
VPASLAPPWIEDADVDALAAAGGQRTRGRLTVRLPAVHGFCGGVRNALATLATVLERAGPDDTVWLLGEIIHNETVNRFFADRGAVLLAEDSLISVFARARPGDHVVVPAFGLPLALMRELEQARDRGAFHLVDTTCGYVQRIWRFVEAQAAAGATVLIQGRPDHPEVRATLSRALTGATAVVQFADPAGARLAASCLAARSWQGYPAQLLHAPEHTRWQRWALVAQTTLLWDEVRAAEEELRAAATRTGAAFASAATVCHATRERQLAARALCAAGCDLILVVGGFSSSNTTQLYRLAAAHARTYFVRHADALGPTCISHWLPDEARETATPDWLPPGPLCVGILAGASCPPGDVGGVLRRLCELAGR